YPNPFNLITSISYNIPEISRVKISIYDISGRFIYTLVDQQRNPGRYSIYWDASTASSGIYICRFKANNFIQTKKMVLIK
ncbi:MAG: glycoside hydrolase, partial [Candidatus Neomarinimicrobiota bacterium]